MAKLQLLKKFIYAGFPGGPVVESPPVSAGEHEFNPWSGRIPHAARKLGLCTTTAEPHVLGPVLHNIRNHCNEKRKHCT